MGRLPHAHGTMHNTVFFGRGRQASLQATERQKARELIPVFWPNKMSPGNKMFCNEGCVAETGHYLTFMVGWRLIMDQHLPNTNYFLVQI